MMLRRRPGPVKHGNYRRRGSVGTVRRRALVQRQRCADACERCAEECERMGSAVRAQGAARGLSGENRFCYGVSGEDSGERGSSLSHFCSPSTTSPNFRPELGFGTN
jgi:hypothetical protein